MSGHLIEQAACGLLPHFFSGIVDGGELGGDDLGDDIVVEAYYRYILRYTATRFFQRLLKYGRTKIIGDKDGVGPGGHVEDLFGGLEGVGFAEIAYEHERGIIGQPVVFKGLLVSFQAPRVYITCEVSR